MRVLITGASGFAGRWLVRELAARTSDEIFALTRGRARRGEFPRGVRTVRCDLADASAVRRTLARVRPQRLYHLAGQASVSASWKDPAATRRDNVAASRNLIGAIERLGLRPEIHVAGSAEVYGRQGSGLLRETAALRPRNPYAKTKAEQERLFSAFARRAGLRVVVTRSFNAAGPEQRPSFALSDFARQIALMEKGLQTPELRVGNLSAVRDFTDIRDVVRAYRMTIETGKGKAGYTIYNVCTGRGRSMAGLLRILISLSRIRVTVRTDPSRLRAVDLPVLVGSRAKIGRATGWRPRIPVRTMLRDTLDYWRKET